VTLDVPTGRAARAWSTRAGGLPREYWFLWWGTFVNRVGTFVQPFLVLYLVRERGLPEATAGLLLSTYGLAGIPSQLGGGVLADRIGRRQTMLLGSVGFAAALAVLGSARSLPLIVVGVLLTGLTSDLFRPASSALVADVVPPADRPRAYGLTFWAVNLGFAVATALAGLLAEQGYGLLFVGDALTTVIFGLVVYRGVGETRPVRDPLEKSGSFLDPFRDRLMIGVIISWFLYACVYFQVFLTLPLAMTADGLAPRTYGLVLALNGVVIVIVQPLSLGWLARLPRMPTAGASMALVGVGFGLNAFAETGWQYAACVVVWTLGEIGVASVGHAVVADIAPAQLRGRYAGAFGIAFGAAGVVAPVLGTAVLASSGASAVWSGCLLIGLVAGAVQLSLSAGVIRRTAVAP